MVGGGVAERGLSGHFLGEQLGVVDEHVGPGGQFEGQARAEGRLLSIARAAGLDG